MYSKFVFDSSNGYSTFTDFDQIAEIITLYADLSTEVPTTLSVLLSDSETAVIISQVVLTKESMGEVTTLLWDFVAQYQCQEKGCTKTTFSPANLPNITGGILKAVELVGQNGIIVMLSGFTVYPTPSEIEPVRQILSELKIYFYRFVIGRGVHTGDDWLTGMIKMTGGETLYSFTSRVESKKLDTDLPTADILRILNAPVQFYDIVQISLGCPSEQTISNITKTYFTVPLKHYVHTFCHS